MQPKQDAPERFIFVDGHAVAFHSWFTSSPNRVIPGFLDMLAYVYRRHGPASLLVAFDPVPPTFRHTLYPRYKADRPVPPEAFLEGCEEMERILASHGIPVCKLDGFEADDVLGTWSAQASAMGTPSLIYTCDLDLLQVVDETTKVEVFSQYRDDRIFDVSSAIRRFGGIAPYNIPDLKALMGDRSDNLEGVPGIGEKTATSILQHTLDIESLYQEIDVVSRLPLRGKERIMRLLTDYKDQAFLMKRLATIVRDAPTGIDLGTSIISKPDAGDIRNIKEGLPSLR